MKHDHLESAIKRPCYDYEFNDQFSYQQGSKNGTNFRLDKSDKPANVKPTQGMWVVLYYNAIVFNYEPRV